jgi:hypothetical protein
MMTITNPLAGATVGSTIKRVSGNIRPTVLAPSSAVTVMVPGHYDNTQYIRGESTSLYTAQMNQGSVSMSGSYGITGVEKMTAAASAYWGDSSASNTKNTTIVCEVLMIGGVEAISLDQIKPSLLLAALTPGAQQDATDALQKYNAMTAAAGTAGLVSVLSDSTNPNYAATQAAYVNWAAAADAFRQNYDDGMVIGVVWGGVAEADLTITEDLNANTWKYGGTGAFTYATTEATVSLGATYDKSGASNESDVKVFCVSDADATCVQGYADTWTATLSNKAFDAVSSVTPFEMPVPPSSTPPPQPPDFVTPKPDPTTESSVEDIKKDGVEGAAKIASYNSAKAVYDKNKKPGDPELTLEKFLKNAEQPPTSKSVRDLAAKVSANALSTLSLVPPRADDDVGLSAADVQDMTSRPVPTAATVTDSDNTPYTPLGIWISDWADLFPWLATGYLNAIDDTTDAENAIKYQMMRLDFLTLSRLYYMAANYNLQLSVPNEQPLDFKQIGNAFSVAYCTLSSKTDDVSFTAIATAAMKPLTPTEHAIYDTWDKIKFLRSAALGFGVLRQNQSAISPTTSVTPAWIQLDDVKYNLNFIMNGGFIMPRGIAQYAPMDNCSFDPSLSNYSAFATFYKLIPLILPRGIIVLAGPGGILCEMSSIRVTIEGDDAVGYPSACFLPNLDSLMQFSWLDGDFKSYTFQIASVVNATIEANIKLISFTPDLVNNVLTSDVGGITAYPIPFFDGLATIDWKGQSFSTNVGADPDLNAKLAQLATDLEKTGQTWTFSSDRLKDNWSADSYYRQSALPVQYFGMVPEPKATF